MKLKTMACLVICISVFSAIGSASIRVEGVQFEKAVVSGGTAMALKGYGLLRYLVFIKAYVGALYIDKAWDAVDVLGPVAKRLELEYFHAIPKEDFAKATRKKILDNVTPAEAARLNERIKRLSELYRDVKPGDRYALTFIPGVGTELALNGVPLGLIQGHDFSIAVFSMWIGSNPIDKEFRDSLLGAI